MFNVDTLNMYVYKGQHIPQELCNKAARAQVEWRPHEWYNNNNESNSHKNSDPLVADCSQELSTDLLAASMKALKSYHEHVRIDAPMVKFVSPARLNSYQTGTFMRSHVDHIASLFDGQVKGIPILSIVGLLTDNFTGGEFVFWDNFTVHLSKGDVLVFPSNFLYPHKVNEVLGGSRLSYVSWAV